MTELNIDALSERLCSLRKSKSMSQSELAKIMNVSNKLISKWECGGGIPNITYLQDYSKLFNISLDELVGDVDDHIFKKKTGRPLYEKILTISIVASVIPFLISLILYNVLPQLIPMHYDFADNITRWGDKNELIILGTALTICPLLMISLFHFIRMHKKQKIIGIMGAIVMGLTFSVVTIVYFVKAYSSVIKNVTIIEYPIANLVLGILGGLIMIAGIISPIILYKIKMSNPFKTVFYKVLSYGLIIDSLVVLFSSAFIKNATILISIVVGLTLTAIVIPIIYYTILSNKIMEE